MHKPITILFLCLSLQLFGSLSPFLSFMTEINSILLDNAVTTYDTAQNLATDLETGNAALLSLMTTTTKTIANLGTTNNPITDSIPLSFINTNLVTSSIKVVGPSTFAAGISTDDGLSNLVIMSYKTNANSSITFSAPVNTIPLFGGAPTSQVQLTTAIESTASSSATLTAFGVNSSNQLTSQTGTQNSIHSSPVTIYQTPPVDTLSPLYTSSSTSYSTVSYLSLNHHDDTINGTIVSFQKTTQTLQFTSDIGPCSKAPSTFTHEDGSITVMMMDFYNNLVHKVIDSKGNIISIAVVDSSITDYYFSANNNGFVVSYTKSGPLSGPLYYSTNTFSSSSDFSGSIDSGSPSIPTLYMKGTAPHSQYFQSETFFIGGINEDGYHQVYYKTPTLLSVHPIYTSSGLASQLLPFKWTDPSTNSSLLIDLRTFFSPLLGELVFKIGPTTSYSPHAVIKKQATQSRMTSP